LQVIAMPAWVCVMLWLFQQTHYRDQLATQVGGKPGFVDLFSYSPRLLDGDAYQVALFVFIWGPPLFAVISFPWIIWKYRRRSAAGDEG
jgi:hypothetical protein